MLNRTITVGSVAALLALATFALAPTDSFGQQVHPIEAKCSGKLGKSARKLAKTYGKETSKCRDNDISSKEISAVCPAPANAKIQSASDKLVAAAEKSCGSFCAISNTIACMDSTTCPPQTNAGPEKCSSKEGVGPDGKNNFDIANLGFPGALCGTIAAATDLGQCVADNGPAPEQSLIDAIYGSIDNASGISSDAAKCLKALSKSAHKLSDTILNSLIKCRSTIQKNGTLSNGAGNQQTCRFDDPKIVDKVAKAETKVLDTAGKKCTDAQILELDLCAGGGGATDTATAGACLVEAATEITDTLLLAPQRAYGAPSISETIYPPVFAACGDGVVNQGPNPFQLLGEECDLDDDAACPGLCVPPGDVFQCTCPGSPRQRFVAEGPTSDLESGWTGTSHNQGVTDGAGYVYSVANCDCATFDPTDTATCTSTTDPLCDVSSIYQQPSCSWDPFGATRCDDHNTSVGPNGVDENDDCWVCDQFSANAGDGCRETSVTISPECQAQCYDAGGTPTGFCGDQSECAAGEVCRGICDTSQSCLIIPNGAPLPISSGGTAVCVDTTFRENVFGTGNIVTGEHEHFIQQYSKVHLGTNNFTPCPVCGGFCDLDNSPALLKGKFCQGTCDGGTVRCRFNSDCPSGELCTTESEECGSGNCVLSLICGGAAGTSGPNEGEPCRIEAATSFGTTSGDCPPTVSLNISGIGLEINFFPQTSETTSLPPVVECSNPGFANFNCPCPDGGGGFKRATNPNLCAFACNAGVNENQGCASGGGGFNGLPTLCTGGGFLACDEDTDCADEGDSGTCSVNPTHCEGTGDPNTELLACATNGDCGVGTCVDACPAGRCVPLCLQADDPFFPPGFGDKSADDPEEGLCAAGPPFYHCDGVGQEFIVCFKGNADGDCDSVCTDSCSGGGVPGPGGSQAACTAQSDCAGGETCCGSCELTGFCNSGTDNLMGTSDDLPGTGLCVGGARNCVINDFFAEGGDTLNGQGDPTNVKAVSSYCIGPTSNSAINATAGLGGPGRLRQLGVNVPSFTALPVP